MDGQPSGEGEHVWNRSGEKEDGAWFNTRNQYKGGFKLGVREGAGVFLYATGARYDGRWADNVKHGPGVYTFDDGTVFKVGLTMYFLTLTRIEPLGAHMASINQPPPPFHAARPGLSRFGRCNNMTLGTSSTTF